MTPLKPCDYDSYYIRTIVYWGLYWGTITLGNQSLNLHLEWVSPAPSRTQAISSGLRTSYMDVFEKKT